MDKKDYDKCPICGSTKIVANRDIKNPFIQCQDCGFYLREGDINHRNDANFFNTATSLNTNNLTIRDNSVILPCASCDKNDVCKYKNTVELSLKRFELEEPFTIEIKCKYYKAITPIIPGYPSYPNPLTNPGITWCGPTCPVCGSKETDPTFVSFSTIPMYKCAKCGHEYTWSGGMVYCGDTITETKTSVAKSDPTVKITGNTEVK